MRKEEMKKVFVILFFVVSHLHAVGQPETIKLSNKGRSIEKLIPAQWKLLATANGDLNKDGISDAVFVVENTDPGNIQLNEGYPGRDTINLNPRMLGIYFGKKSGKLLKQLQSDSFILLQDSPTMDEPFAGIEILEGGVLKIDFKFWYSAGSWYMSNHTYKFKFQNDRFELIGYDASERHRGSGEETDYSVNFLTGKMNIIRTTFDENNQEIIEAESKEFILKELKSIQSLHKPFRWAFNGIYL